MWNKWGSSQVQCRECSKPLGYYAGSIMDDCDKEKLCGSCAGKKLAEETIAIFEKALQEIRS